MKIHLDIKFVIYIWQQLNGAPRLDLILLRDGIPTHKFMFQKMDEGIDKILNVSWRFGVTAASSESDNVDKSFVQLHITFSKGHKTKNIFTEMSIAEFYKFLHDLEKAKCSVDLLV